ncbi:iron-sulfur cluster repair di-iron protein, ric [Sharpea azabuensis]|uniref:iron-sulfur cluster repair di-iron protein, ric n=1 Tax=Sharpea azabuensis TaxID=322505 RepID=UPI0013DB0488|nr:iron-sulfur cluster repair di-iron protein, ric [Sharpea azabuensis]
MIQSFYNTNNAILDLYTKAITKAHGQHHPEVFKVRTIYKEVQNKINHNQYDLTNEFSQLRIITNDYFIPNDVCGTFKATYEMLKAFDEISTQ